MLNIVLIGMTGCGKTSLGTDLANILGRPFLDFDDVLEKEVGCTITQLVQEKGVEHFRTLEKDVIKRLATLDGHVIGTGGGAVLDPENIKNLQKNGVLVWISRDIEDIISTLEFDHRPLIRDADEVRALYAERIDIYKASAMVVVQSCHFGCGIEELVALAEAISTPSRYAVIGKPIGHSISPEIHLPILAAHRDEVTYEKVELELDELEGWVKRVREEKIDGFNVTIPYKLAIMPYLDALDFSAMVYGCVNTVVNRDGVLTGYSTDSDGFYTAIEEEIGTVQGKNLLFLGAGGAAMALVKGGILRKANQITILARDPEKARKLTDPKSQTTFVVGSLEDSASHTPTADILINCTPLGMEGVEATFEDLSFIDTLPSTAVVCDLIYKPAETALLKRAKDRGLVTQNGLSMLIYQGLVGDSIYLDANIDFKENFQKIKNLL
ncbi:MAG: shikimate dehydrogenase [Eubacteriales bacterium]